MGQCRECRSDVPAGSARCPACGAEIPTGQTESHDSLGSTPNSDMPLGTSMREALEALRDSAPRFLPGVVLLDRYRIVSVVGRGGMGEVYRADDLQLGEQVALKFLARELVGDPAQLARLQQEVRVARKVSHPLVCRVHDISEVDGEAFLTMEFIDGEDLGSLLKRIGRFSEDKGLQIARQLCEGLGAVHQQGIVHRDLKPGNVMIDGRGRVRLTDFGLALPAATKRTGAFHSGTPVYMAPEQLAGKPPTIRSDLFSLGLVLYEVFSGRRAYPAQGREELTRLHDEYRPSSVCDVVPGLDTRIGKVVRQCMERDPGQRPKSAQAVAAALPRGDALATALAEGRTPSPEIVANATFEGRLAPAWATALFLTTVLGVLAAAWLANRAMVTSLTPLSRSPAALAARARTILDQLGCTDEPADQRYGFAYDTDLLNHTVSSDRTPQRWDAVEKRRAPAIQFWFRQGPRLLIPLGMSPRQFPGAVTHADPPIGEDEVRVKLAPDGRLVEFTAPPTRAVPKNSVRKPVDYALMFKMAELDWQSATETSAEWYPPFHSDQRQAWEATLAGVPQGPRVRVEAAALDDGCVVYFRVFHGPWEQADSLQMPLQNESRAFTYLYAGLIGVVVVVAAWLARVNQRSGRGDALGATRLALFVFACHVVSLTLVADHTSSFRGETVWLMRTLGFAGLWSGMCWLLYFAFEPYVRRRWPWRMITWNRVLAGRVTDPMVGRDLLIGSLMGVALTLLLQLAVVLPAWLGHVRPAPLITWPTAFTNVPFHLVMELPPAIRDSLLWFFVLFLLVLIVGRVWLATVLVFALVLTYFLIQESELHLYWVGLMGASTAISFFIAMRFGLLAMTVGQYVCYFLYQVPLTLDPSSWYWWPSFAYMAWAVAIAAFGYFVARGGRPDPYAGLAALGSTTQ